jgi:hypothetical protein
MPLRSLNTVATICWLTLLLSAIVLFLFLLLTPEVAIIGSTSRRDEEIHSINAETNISIVQQMATTTLSASYGTGTTATMLCRVAIVVLLFVVIGSIISLVHVRRVRKQLRETKSAV